jgi:membrane protease YdiL (CAAX protease family)
MHATEFLLLHWEKDPLVCLMGAGLLLALGTLWINKGISILFALACAGLAYYMGRLNPMAAGALAVLVGLLVLDKQLPKNNVLRSVLFLAVVSLVALSFFHMLPGFTNWQILAPTHVSAAAPLYDFYLNIDKGLMGYILLLFLLSPAHNRRDWMTVFKGAGAIAPWAVLCLLGTTYALGWIAYDPKFPAFIGLWIPINLLTVSLVEETFYRGLIQERLTQWLGPWKALSLTTVTFVAAHCFFTQDWRYLSLIAIASFFYGLTYTLTKRLEAAVLVHFSVNLIHILFWTYPRIIGG